MYHDKAELFSTDTNSLMYKKLELKMFIKIFAKIKNYLTS